MPLFEMKPGELVAVPSSTFADEKVLERVDLQRLLGHYENYLAAVEPEAADEAQARLAEWLDD